MCKLLPGQKGLCNTANTTLTLCRQHANTKLAKQSDDKTECACVSLRFMWLNGNYETTHNVTDNVTNYFLC